MLFGGTLKLNLIHKISSITTWKCSTVFIVVVAVDEHFMNQNVEIYGESFFFFFFTAFLS